jgi:hypothetical protein
MNARLLFLLLLLVGCSRGTDPAVSSSMSN